MYVFKPDYGVSGDMLLSALLSISEIEPREIIPILEAVGGVMGKTKVSIKPKGIGSLKGLQLYVKHKRFSEVKALELRAHLEKAISDLSFTKGEKLAQNILDTLLKAEAKVHSLPMKELHLHETGSPDTLVDLVGICYLYEYLKMDSEKIYSTPVAVGSGTVKTLHGVFNVPPPAVAEILKGMKWFMGPFKGEMATPTGVAALKNLVDGFISSIPKEHSPISVGIGVGSRRFGGNIGYLMVEWV